MKPLDLRSREWVAVFILLAGFIVLSKNAWQAPATRWPTFNGDLIEKPVILIAVRIQGAVKNPGIFNVKEGTKIKEVLDLSVLDEDADLSRIDLEKPVHKGQKLTIRKKRAKKLRQNEEN